MTRTKKKGSRRNQSKNSPSDDYREPIDKSDMRNERFETYYKAQNILSDDSEWNSFLDVLKRGLPTTFRVAGSRITAHTLNKSITDMYVPLLSHATFEGEVVPPPARIPWYPDGLAWQFNVSKKILRKSPEFKKFHSFLVFETEIGNISRQEAVSMLPPLFMDVEPHHMVLDMCAAPGSKTAQLLEALHVTDTPSCTSTPPGVLIANDSDHKRCHLLVHQMTRLGSPSLMVTNLDASIFPIIRVPQAAAPVHSSILNMSKTADQSNETMQQKRVRRKKIDLDSKTGTGPLLFDRILCDVPCSGDGTIRKNLGIWRSWNGGDGNGLHGLQLRILQRAMKMLKDEGRIVYSTCSLNPVENEAVIAAALQSNPEYELIDVSSRLPELIRRPGLQTWKPTVDSKTIDTSFVTYETFMESLPDDKKMVTKMLKTHWPPEPKEVAGLRLERCMRIYPHLQDTGGFFVAVLQKKSGAKENDESAVNPMNRKRGAGTPVERLDVKKPKLEDEENDVMSPIDGIQPDSPKSTSVVSVTDMMEDVIVDAQASAIPKPTHKADVKAKGKAKGEGGFKENPYTFLAPDDPILQSCIKQLNLDTYFPASNVLVRNPEGDAVRSLYLTNDIIKAIVQHNDYARLRVINSGTKVFTKQEGGRGMDASFRVLGEGLPVVLPYIDPTTIIDGDIEIIKTLISVYYPLCGSFAEPFKSAVEARAPGSHVVRFSAGKWDDVTLAHELVLPIWKSNVSVTLMIDKKAKSALSLRLFGEDVTREAARQNKSSAVASKAIADEANDSAQGVDGVEALETEL